MLETEKSHMEYQFWARGAVRLKATIGVIIANSLLSDYFKRKEQRVFSLREVENDDFSTEWMDPVAQGASCGFCILRRR